MFIKNKYITKRKMYLKNHKLTDDNAHLLLLLLFFFTFYSSSSSSPFFLRFLLHKLLFIQNTDISRLNIKYTYKSSRARHGTDAALHSHCIRLGLLNIWFFNHIILYHFHEHNLCTGGQKIINL